MVDSVSMSISSNSCDSVSNGNRAVESSLKRNLDIDLDSSPRISVKYKWQRLSAFREFPLLCGRFATIINQEPCETDKTVDTAECSTHKSEGVCAVGSSLDPFVNSESDETSNCSDQMELNDMSKGTDRIGIGSIKSAKTLTESINSLKSARPKITELLKVLDKSKLVNFPKTSKPKAMELPKDVESSKNLDQTERVDSLKTLESKMDLLQDFYQMESNYSSKSLGSKSQDQTDLGLDDCSLLSRDSGHANTSDSSIVLVQPQLPVSKTKAVEECLSEKQHPWKRASANREFPLGYGRNAHRDTEREMKLVDSLKSLKPEIELPEASAQKGVGGTESNDLLKTSGPETTELIKDLDKSELFNLLKIFEPKTTELPKDMDQVELLHSSETIKPETLEFSEDLVQREMIDLSKALKSNVEFYQMGSNSASESLEPNTRDQTNLGPADSSLLANTCESSIVLNRPQLSIFETEVEDHLFKKYPPQSRGSTNREFPPGCGRNALPVSWEELKAIKSLDNENLRSLLGTPGRLLKEREESEH